LKNQALFFPFVAACLIDHNAYSKDKKGLKVGLRTWREDMGHQHLAFGKLPERGHLYLAMQPEARQPGLKPGLLARHEHSLARRPPGSRWPGTQRQAMPGPAAEPAGWHGPARGFGGGPAAAREGGGPARQRLPPGPHVTTPDPTYKRRPMRRPPPGLPSAPHSRS